MEKRGEILTQMALISDLLEKVNLESEETMVVFNLNGEEFKRVFEKIAMKSNLKVSDAATTFSVKIGEIEYAFAISKNNV